MTRINTIDPRLLPMPWLVAEYRELPRILNRTALGKPFLPTPPTYRMGEGHMSFFGDKLLYLYRRHELLRAELMRRAGAASMSCDHAYEQCEQQYPELCNDWEPATADHVVNLTRLYENWHSSKRMYLNDWNAWFSVVRATHPLPSDVVLQLWSEPKC